MLKETSTTFRDFFQERFFHVDRKYVDITMSKMLSEMAVPNDISKYPIKPDKDDIEFLRQFPAQYWAQAMHQRYHDDLKEALKEREARRAPIEKRLYGLLKRALYSGDFSKLRGQVSEELMTRLNNGDYSHAVGEEETTDKAATYLAEMETEKAVPHASGTQEEGLPAGYKRYTFKKSRNGEATITFLAKPNLNRLIHKLERTRGHEHHPESGLQSLGMTHGQYGYDLYGVTDGDEDKPHTTRGMQMPPRDEVATRLSDYLGHNSHRMYGDLPDGPDIVWKPVGEGRTMYKDNWTVRKIENKVFSRIFSTIATAEPGTYTLPDGTRVPPEGGFENESQRRAAAAAIAKAEVIKMAEAGKLKGPPIPGIAPEGKIIGVKDVGGKKVLDVPPLYLPHKKTQVMIQDSPGSPPRSVTHEIPLVNPAEYLRQLGSEEGDESIDASSLRGHESDYVHVPHNDYKKSRGYLASGSLHVTHNTSGRQHLDPSDPEYQEKKQEIEDAMGTTGLGSDNGAANNGEGQFFADIIKGIWNCIKSACGGMTNHEVEIMKQNVPDLHTMVYQKMMMNLRDKRLETASGRRAFARNVASSWAQQDLGSGGGTRRLRRLKQTARTSSMDATTSGESGDALSLRDSIQQQMKEKDAGDTKLGRGEKLRPGAGQHAFPYNIDNFRQMVAEMEAEAGQADSDRDRAIAMSRTAISDEIADLIGDAIADKAAVIIKLEYLLAQLFMGAGSGSKEAEQQAAQKVAGYVASGKGKTKSIIAAFKADNSVQQLLSAPDAAPDAAAADALERLKGILEQLPPDKKMEPATQGMIYKYIEQQPPEVRSALKAEADKAFGKTPAPAAVAQPKQQAATAAVPPEALEVNKLIAAKNWLAVANNPYFLRAAPVSHFTAIIGKMEAEMQSKAGMEREHYEFAVAHLRSILRRKQQTPGLSDIT